MAVLRSSSALNTPTLKRRASDASTDSGSTEPIEYDLTPEMRKGLRAKDVETEKTVRKGQDYRPASTFYKKPYREMTTAEKLCDLARTPNEIHLVKPESIDRGPIPIKWIIPEQLWILSRALAPMALQAASTYFFPNFKWPALFAYSVYLLFFAFGTAMGVVHRLAYYSTRWGLLDEKNYGRDRTPDQAVGGLAKGILLYMALRTALPFYFYYNKDVLALTDFTWTYPFRLMAWQIVLDYFFYCYHRTTHEVDALWFIHQHHHTTKHPTAILSILAEDYQECLEVVLVPLAATYFIPMTFSELYTTLCFTLYVEMLGHSGVRAHWPHPSLFWLKHFNMDLVVEDHDLHHRFGKSGKNYGKQTRVWDRIFGTTAERIESFGL